MNKRLFGCVAVLLVLGFFVGLNYGCIWKNNFGFECPSCGLSRAWLFAIKGDFPSAFSMHPMFFYPPLLLIYLTLKRPVCSRKVDIFILSVLGLMYIALYLFKLLS